MVARPPLHPLLCLIAACGGGGGATDAGRVVHLDPRLADGRAPMEAFTGEEVLRQWVIDAPTPEEAFGQLEPWTFVNALGLPGTPRSQGGLRIRAADYRPEDGVVHAALRFDEPVDTARFDRIEVDLVHLAPGSAALTWRTREPLAGVEPGHLRAEAVTVGGKLETIAFDLSAHPGWRGVALDLELLPVFRGGQSYELKALRFVRRGFGPGHQPGRDHGGGEGDGGLLGFAGDQRRTWPTDDGVPLFDRVRVPPGGRVVAEVALPGSMHGSLRPAHFALDVRVGTGPWQERARRSLLPGRYPERARWRDLVADLGDLAGREVDLRLRAWFGSGDRPGVGGEPRRASFWWGAPMVFGTPGAHRPPNVLLVTLDTLRTDAIGAYGGTAVTPFLDALAAEGLLFENAFCACNSTLPSHTSLLTGLPVPTHGVHDNRSTLAAEVRTLAQALRAAGYHTAAAVSVEHLQAGWSGLGRGFDQYLDVQPGAPVDGAATVARVLEWSERWAAQGDRPVFLWLHLFDPHTPYGPPRPFLVHHVARWRAGGGQVPPSQVDPATVGPTGYSAPGKFLEGVTNADFARFLYEASVAYTDELVRDVVWSWREAGRWDDTLCIVTADHGESLGEQDVWYGHQLLHTPVMHVPLIVRAPGVAGGRVAARAWNPDLVRTLVEHLGLAGLDPAGVDLLGLPRGGVAGARPVWFVHAGLDQVGVRDEDVHYWHNVEEYLQLGRDRAQPKGQDFLYRHAVDPGLLTNLAGVEPELAARYAGAMREWLARARSGRHVRADLTAADRQRLDDMGYGGDDEGTERGGEGAGDQ